MRRIGARGIMKQIVESERIGFVEVSESLAQDYLVMVNDENDAQWFSRKHEPYTEADEIAWVQRTLAEKKPVFSMIEKATGNFIGNIELMDVHDSVAELGIHITAAKQVRGFGTEAVAAITTYGFDRLGLKRIFLRTNPLNARAICVYTKCGFREYGRDEKHVYMEIVRSDRSGES